MKKPIYAMAALACVLACVVQSSVGSEESADYVDLFNGRDLTGWTGDTEGYQAENGELVCKPGGNLYTEGEYDNFHFQFEFKLTPGANNGLGIRVEPGTHAATEAIEIQILDDTADKYTDLKPWQFHGSIYGIVPAKQGALKPVGEWNHQEVIADGHQIKVILNGQTIVDADLKEATRDGMPDGKEHPGLFKTSGRIGFIGHGDILYFRNIKVKKL